MTARASRRAAAGTLAVAVALAALSHPDVAFPLVRVLGIQPGTPVPVARLLWLAQRHLALALGGFALAGGLGLALGIAATRAGGAGLRGAIETLAAAAQGAPPVVVVGLALPILGFGAPPVLLALAAYGLMPVLRGTVDALTTVPGEVRAAAVAMGLTPAQVLWRVELPLAAGPILEALRVVMVLAVATAAIGALAGAPTLGTPIVVGLQNQSGLALIQGAAAAAALAFLADAAFLAATALLRPHA
ncbi:Glycine betaine uptake system permease protein YehW [Methylobacterium crusticola]|uniref:Glycine betaine uptake system permease protein YehW n=1 Tax=Methylobacterium crusticola TaxID=1697972 RepID=A0ABQ4R2D4_9HYPH|nr:ABC transporter permease subunit [Methylobacterium crusticola]GJD51034.1 Glycine betaine uptake system permease protein YehW [Methylobacterium crusticola]